MENIEFEFSPEDWKELIKKGAICFGSEHGSGGGSGFMEFQIARAVHWFTNKDCALITAWRNGQTRAVKDGNNRELLNTLRDYGYGVVKVTGFYAEKGCDTSKENSFMVFNLNDDPRTFFRNLFNLSMKYEQDSFLYKRAGLDEDAFLINTNENTGIKTCKKVGKLVIDCAPEGAYTKIKSRNLAFRD